MYNRYIPQSDGSFQRNRIHEQRIKNPTLQQEPPPQIKADHSPQPRNPCPAPSGNSTNSATSFLKQLIPKNFDTSDLFIVLLLLLMAGDCEEEKSNALLTLALYFFL